jgi:2-keto-4-pentenoate hydratase/2-oxohepta-3-ene-1,7-dioic acid hydratase in catechol pathway
MRLISYRTVEQTPRLGVAVGDHYVPAADVDPNLATIQDLLDDVDGALGVLTTETAQAAFHSGGRPLTGVTVTAPIPRPGKVVCVGQNYREHLDEQDVDAPESPALFSKWPSCVIGPGDEIRWDPALTSQVDWEAELGVVIGRAARHVPVDMALDHVLGYTCLNDVSARDLQFGDLQWTRGKSLDTFCPMGPVLVTTDEIVDPQELDIECVVSGEVMQSSNTSQMFYGVAEIISFCSDAFTLEPGDVIATGTPGGVGIFRDEPRLLGDGDVVTVRIEDIGELTNTCRFEPVP